MRKFQLTDIRWETDGADVDLPTEVTLEVEGDNDPENYLADDLSDKYGWLVIDFNYKEIE